MGFSEYQNVNKEIISVTQEISSLLQDRQFQIEFLQLLRISVLGSFSMYFLIR